MRDEEENAMEEKRTKTQQQLQSSSSLPSSQLIYVGLTRHLWMPGCPLRMCIMRCPFDMAVTYEVSVLNGCAFLVPTLHGLHPLYMVVTYEVSALHGCACGVSTLNVCAFLGAQSTRV